MNRTPRIACQALLPLSVLLIAASAARGEHAVIKLEVSGPNVRQESFGDTEPPLGGVYPRRRISVKAGDPLVLQFLMTYTNPHKQADGAVVRYFVVRSGSFAVKTVTNLTQGVVTQGKVTLNFKPDGRVGARLKFRIEDPGIYLVRVDSLNTDSDHEHFSAMDLEVK